eukprot:2465845-Pleurochrysis_carterae.AAC.2
MNMRVRNGNQEMPESTRARNWHAHTHAQVRHAHMHAQVRHAHTQLITVLGCRAARSQHL